MGAATRAIQVSEGIVPVSDFKAKTADLLGRVAETGQPLVIDRLSEKARFIAAVEEGLADADAGRLRDHAGIEARMTEQFGSKLRKSTVESRRAGRALPSHRK
jgi:hypothetical protein